MNYFDFIIYLAFETILLYENKRSLTLEQLHNYREKLCKKHMKQHEQYTEYDDLDFEDRLRKFHKLNKSMTIDEEQKEFEKFIDDNSELFSYENGAISLKEKVSFDELNSEKFELSSYDDKYDQIICGELIGLYDCVECIDILEAKKIQNAVSNIIKDEKAVESAYLNYRGLALQEQIEKLSAGVSFRLSLIGNLGDYQLTCYHRTIVNSGELDLSAKGNDFWLLSDLLMENDPFYEVNSQIDCFLENKYQRAIFDSGTLVYDVLRDAFDMMWAYRDPDFVMEFEPADSDAFCSSMAERMEQKEMFEDEFDDECDEDEFDNDDENYMNQVACYLYEKKISMAFYLNYIDHINQHQKCYGDDESLENAKRRLLYVLDGYGDDLYKEENFEKALGEVSIEGGEPSEVFSDFYAASRLFLVDILENWADDDLLIKKLLFVSTYYDLTHDKRINKILDKYAQTEMGQKVTISIFEHDYGTFNQSSLEKPKEMQKKNTNGTSEKKD